MKKRHQRLPGRNYGRYSDFGEVYEPIFHDFFHDFCSKHNRYLAVAQIRKKWYELNINWIV